MESKNKIIAEFMGYRYETGVSLSGSWSRYFKNGGTFEDSFPEAKYDTSWDWLMPVVEKIEAIPGAYVDIHREATKVKFCPKEISEWSHTAWNQESKITHVYTAVTKFIEWYNSQKDGK